MWLLDVNVPRDIAGLLGELGINAQHSNARGWNGLTNGALVEAAWTNNFVCVLTRDRLFAESAARALKKFPKFSVVLITIPQVKGTQFLSLFQAAWAENPIQPIPGLQSSWP